MTERGSHAVPSDADPPHADPPHADGEPVDLEPVDPEEVGVEPETPDMMQIEAARLLANDARDRLRDLGFEDRQIERWANTYTAEHGSGDVETFLAWVARQEDAG